MLPGESEEAGPERLERLELWVAGARGTRRKVVVEIDSDGAVRCDCGEPECAHLELARGALGRHAPAAAPQPAAAAGRFGDELLRFVVALSDRGLVGDGVALALGALIERARIGRHERVARRLCELQELRGELEAKPRSSGRLRAAHLLAELHAAAQPDPARPEAASPPRLLETPLPLGALERSEELRLIEVGRDLRRSARSGFDEVSYLLELDGGRLFREVRPLAAGARPGLFEPFARRLGVQLAGLHPGPEPRRIELMQYELLGPPGEHELTALLSLGAPSLAQLAERLASGPRAVLIAPLAGPPIARHDGIRLPLVDGELAVAGDPGDHYRLGLEQALTRAVVGVFGRMVALPGQPGRLGVLPLSLVVSDPRPSLVSLGR